MKTGRAIVFYSGRVQGVGFRYTCRSLAMEFAVTGYVKNLTDGRVELAAEGGCAEIEAFLRAIDGSDLKPYIRQRSVEWQAATGQWQDFHIAGW